MPHVCPASILEHYAIKPPMTCILQCSLDAQVSRHPSEHQRLDPIRKQEVRTFGLSSTHTRTPCQGPDHEIAYDHVDTQLYGSRGLI